MRPLQAFSLEVAAPVPPFVSIAKGRSSLAMKFPTLQISFFLPNRENVFSTFLSCLILETLYATVVLALFFEPKCPYGTCMEL